MRSFPPCDFIDAFFSIRTQSDHGKRVRLQLRSTRIALQIDRYDHHYHCVVRQSCLLGLRANLHVGRFIGTLQRDLLAATALPGFVKL